MDNDKNKDQENLDSQEEQENENIDSTEQEESQDDQQTVEVEDNKEAQEVQDESVPLATFLDEKKKRKALESKNKVLESKVADMEDAKFDDSIKNKKALIKKDWLDRGFDEPTAEAAAEMAANMYKDFGSIRQSKKDIILDNQIDELSTDNFYSDIKDYKAQIKSKIKSFSKAGETLTVEEAYLMVVGPRIKMKEAQIDQEIKNSVSSSKSGVSKKSNVATSSGTSTKSTKLSPEDAKNLKILQKLQPDYEWTAEKFIKRINS